MNLSHELKTFNDFLKTDLAPYLSGSGELDRCIAYSLFSGGKRIRPMCTIAFALAFRGKHAIALRCATAIEMIHTYSLIHDDLPAMDNDDTRRGIPTSHIVFGEAMAILAGDALLNLAPEYLIKELTKLNVPPAYILELIQELLSASGKQGMILGQVEDMELEGKRADLIKLKRTHEKKTGALLSWSCLAGLYSTLSAEKIQTYRPLIKEMGCHFGILFQIVDDLIDELQDASSNKLTYVSLLGKDGATKEAISLFKILEDQMKQLPADWSILKELLEGLRENMLKA